MNCYRYGGSCEELCDLYPCTYAKGYKQGMADARADERAKVVDEVKQLICPKDIKCHPSCKFAYFKIIGECKAEYHCEIEQLKEQK